MYLKAIKLPNVFPSSPAIAVAYVLLSTFSGKKYNHDLQFEENIFLSAPTSI